MSHRPALFSAFLLSVAAAAASTDSPPAAGADGLLQTWAIPLHREPPRFPRRVLERGQEGWVDVSFVVETDGSVTDPVVESSSGVAELERAALNAVRAWEYAPATRNGVPVQQCEVRTRLTFAISFGGKPGASRGYIRRMRAISRLSNAGQHEEALANVLELQQTQSMNRYETARTWAIRATLEQQLGYPEEQLVESLRPAAADSWIIHNDALHRSLLEALLATEIGLRHYQRAIGTAERLREEVPDKARRDEIERVITELFALRDNSSYLTVNGRIAPPTVEDGQPSFWTHQPLRRQFGIEDVNGRISGIDVRCQWHRALLEYDPDVALRLPEDWGDCDVYVHGEPGSTFTLVEYPLTTS